MPDLVLTPTRLNSRCEDADLLIVGPSLGTSVSDLWSECVERLGDEFDVVGWDLPGHGRNATVTNGFSVHEVADAVVRLTESLRLEGRRCWYAGVSLGGAVGLDLALHHGLFDGVVVITSAATIGDPSSWRERADLVRREGTAAMVEPSSHRWFSPGFAAREPEVAARLLSSLANTDRDSYAAACGALAEYDLCSRLTEIGVPLLLVPGSEDRVVSLAHATDTADKVPGAKVHVLDGCGHLPPAEVPAELAFALRDFFAHHRSKASQS